MYGYLGLPLVLKLKRLLFPVGSLLLLWVGLVSGRAEVAVQPVGDEVLLGALPEQALPGLAVALERAMNQSARVIGGLLDVDQARSVEKQARAPMLPYAAASASMGVSKNRYDYDKYLVKDANGAQVLDAAGNPREEPARSTSAVVQDLSYNASVNQPIYYWGALKKGFQSAQLQRAVATRNVEEIKRVLAIDVRRAYFNLINAVNNREADKAALAKLEEDRDYFIKQVAIGFMTQATVTSANQGIEDFKIQMQRSQNNLDALWLAFCELTGLERNSPLPTFPKEIPAIHGDLDAVLPKLAVDAGTYTPTNLLNAEDTIQAEKLNYQIAGTRLRPRLGLSVYASRGYHSPDTTVVFGGPYVLTNVGVGTTVNWAIFDGFSTQAAKQSSRIRLRQQERTRDQLKRDNDEVLKNNLSNLRLNWQSLKTTEKNLNGARSMIETMKKDYEAGLSPKQVWDTAVTGADTALYAANNARADYYIQIVTYLSLRGKDPAVNGRATGAVSR